MQRKVIASAVALGLSASLLTVPAAYAAEIGPRTTNNTCSVKLDQAEKDYLAKLNKNYTEKKVFEVFEKGIEGAYPEIKGWADSTLKSATVQSALKKIEAQRTDDLTAAEEEAFEAAYDKLMSYNQDNYVGYFYGYARLMESYPRVAKELVYNGDIPATSPLSFTEVVASNEALPTADVASFAAEQLGIPTGRIEAFKKAANKTAHVKTGNAVQKEYNPAVEKAMAACAQGGNATVAFPTKGWASNPFNTPEENVGAIVGIVLGTLAAVGLLFAGVVALAPQFGIALPFNLPQLPF
ncbi:hypothetical protein QP172_00280 [Corynebacterium coyleae]|uniref:hypothetical protein n=1 Tax=Corynebacterium TaxID=1716 RepID=UPI0008A45DBA|nr:MULTISPECIES: hypothetical protein [Corynebacterium]MDK6492172.1 hypothetical protein [Corynebacterium coyleae]OFU56690.1 hypothetical protein HMPREF3120_04515 [Corynebacterium sp. HMSC11D10]